MEKRVRKNRRRHWEAPDMLFIPPTFIKRMAADGFKVRWIRWRDPEARETDRVDRRWAQREWNGWEFVRPQECPEFGEVAPTVQHTKLGSLIAVGDLALAVIPQEWAEEDQDKAEKAAADLMGAIKQNIKQMQDPRMPISDKTKITVTTGGGKEVKFKED